MSIFKFSANKTALQLIPPALRNIVFFKWISVLVSPIENLYKLVFDDYKKGSGANDYIIGANYFYGDRVRFSDGATYMCFTSTSSNPLDNRYWVKLSENFIGTDERINFNSQLIVFEYALNRWFRVDKYEAKQIYIENKIFEPDCFTMGNNSFYSSNIPNDPIYQKEYMSENPIFGGNKFNYTIYMPITVYNGLGNDDLTRTKTVREFADKYNLTGLEYNVETF